MIIESKDNKIIKYAKQIQIKKYSELFGECFLETEKVVFDCLKKNLEIKTILICDKSLSKYNNLLKYDIQIVQISSKIAEFISQNSSGSDIFAIVKIPTKDFDFNSNFIVFENLQDPANIGAIIRSGLAFGYKNVISINSVYPYLNKTIRSSMTYIFDCAYKEMTFKEFKNFKEENKINLFVADMYGENINRINNKNLHCLVVGNEGNGISSEMKKLADNLVSIPMQNGVESLNASVAASIIMNLLSKGE